MRRIFPWRELALLWVLSTIFCVVAVCFGQSPVGASATHTKRVLEFTADWCEFCQRLKPTVDKYILAGYRISPVSIDDPDIRRIADEYRITKIPTFVVLEFRDGRWDFDQPKAMQTLTTEAELRKFFVENGVKPYGKTKAQTQKQGS